MPTIHEWSLADKVIPLVGRTLLYGPPGTGKTTAATLANLEGREVCAFSCHEEISVAEIVGHFVPVGDRFIWQDGPALKAWRIGARLVIDEVDQASGAVLSVLRAILNDKSVARLDIPNRALAGMSDAEMAEALLSNKGSETVRPAEGFQVVATMNGVPEDLDEPLRDRFEAVINIVKPHPDAIASLPEDLRKAAVETTKTDDSERRVGIRRWNAFAALREEIGEDNAAQAVFGARAGDVLDALKLARPEAPAKFRDKPKDKPKSAGGMTDFIPPTEPASEMIGFNIKTGTRGRPPIAKCDKHGPMTMDRASFLKYDIEGHVKAEKGNAWIGHSGTLYCTECEDAEQFGTAWNARL